MTATAGLPTRARSGSVRLNQRAGRAWAHYARPVAARLGLWLLLAFFLLPILWVITSSFKDRAELYQTAPHLLVYQPTLENYTYALRKLPNFPLYYRNS